jgi:predicted metal-dependent hydrolase
MKRIIITKGAKKDYTLANANGLLSLTIAIPYEIGIIQTMKIRIDRVIRSHRKSIAIILQNDGKLVVRAPMRISAVRIQEFVNSKSAWIFTHQEKSRTRVGTIHKFINGENFLFLGQAYPLKLVDHQETPLKLDGCFSLKRSAQPRAMHYFSKWYRQQARQVFNDKVQFFAAQVAGKVGKIRLSSARTRWGSCSSRGTLSLTWRLIMAPVEIIDYVVIHELIHLEIKNHSSSFWKKVQDRVPDYKKRRAWLKDNGYLLTLDE